MKRPSIGIEIVLALAVGFLVMGAVEIFVCDQEGEHIDGTGEGNP